MKVLCRLIFVVCSFSLLAACASLRGTGDLGVVIERATGSVQIVDATHAKIIKSVVKDNVNLRDYFLR